MTFCLVSSPGYPENQYIDHIPLGLSICRIYPFFICLRGLRCLRFRSADHCSALGIVVCRVLAHSLCTFVLYLLRSLLGKAMESCSMPWVNIRP